MNITAIISGDQHIMKGQVLSAALGGRGWQPSEVSLSRLCHPKTLPEGYESWDRENMG